MELFKCFLVNGRGNQEIKIKDKTAAVCGVAAGVMSYSGSIRVSVSRYNEQCCLGWVHPHAGPQCGDRGKKAEITVSSKQAAAGDTGQAGEMVVAL